MNQNNLQKILYTVEKDKVIFKIEGDKTQIFKILNDQDKIKGEDIYEFIKKLDIKEKIILEKDSSNLDVKNSKSEYFVNIFANITKFWNDKIK